MTSWVRPKTSTQLARPGRKVGSHLGGSSGPPWTDLWLFEFDKPEATAAALDTSGIVLEANELARARGFASPIQAGDYTASRVLLRRVLMEYGYDGRAAFQHGADGKPYLPGGPSFSLSRTRRAAVIAVSNCDIGIDLERRRSVTLTEPRIAEAAMVLARHGGLSSGRQESLQVWTAVEAWVKWRGSSMAAFLQDQTAIAALENDLSMERANLRPLDLPDGLLGALCSGTECKIQWRTA